MASKIQSRHLYLAIAPYRIEALDEEFNELDVTADYNQYTHVFYVGLHAGWKTGWGGHGCVIMGDGSPLSSSIMVPVKESPKNSRKTIDEMAAALELAQKDIVQLFDRRMWPELRQFVKDVALYGYTAPIAKRVADLINGQKSNESINSQKSEETMAKELKAADLIGKTIVVGENIATIEIKGVKDNGNLDGVFKKGDAAPIAMPVTMANLQAMLERGVWKIQGETPKTEPKAEDDVQEVENIEPTKPKAKEDGRGKKEEPKAAKGEKSKDKPKDKPKAEKPKAEKQKPEVVSDGKLTYETYTSSKGKQCARILGFGENDPAYVNAADIHGSASWLTADGKRTLYVAFGPKYAAAAKYVCDALNAGKTFEDCKAIIEGTPKATAAETKTEKTYTLDEVARKLKRIMGDDNKSSIEDIKKLLEAA